MTRSFSGRAPVDGRVLASLYLFAKERLILGGYAEEIDWQEEVAFENLDVRTFLREAAWVVLSSGFRESVVRSRFPEISAAFCHWEDTESILAQCGTCRQRALRAFGNQRKIDAIINIVERVADLGIESIRGEIRRRGLDFLMELPFVGPVTSCHLAKNIGLVMAKPDRHLSRISARAGYESVRSLCLAISELVGDSLSVVDLVIWRYATMARERRMGHGRFGEPTFSGRPAEASRLW